MAPANGLSPAEAERLAMLAEEAGEVVQAAAKVLRHGYESFHPDDPSASNRARLEREITDLRAVLAMLLRAGDIGLGGLDDITAARERKLRYAHHQH